MILASTRRFSLVGDSPGPAVGDVAGLVDGAEVQPGGHVAVLQRELHAQGAEHAAADLVDQRVVAEQAQVPRPAAGRDAGGHRARAGRRRAAAGQGVEVGLLGLLQGGALAGVVAVAQAVHHQQDDPLVVLDRQRTDQVAVCVFHFRIPYIVPYSWTASKKAAASTQRYGGTE